TIPTGRRRAMGSPSDRNVAAPETTEAGSPAVRPPARGGTSRREFVKSGAGLVAGGAAALMLPGRALAQEAGVADTDAELRALRGQRRILLRGGVVLTLDRQVGT